VWKLKDKMRAVVLTAPESLELKEVPVSEPQFGQALVKVKSTAVCRSDVSGYLGHHPMIDPPRIMGHECSGVLEKLGPGVEHWSIGDEVIVETFFYSCGRCPGCRSGRYNVCNDVKVIGHNVDGSFAEYALVNASFIYEKPEEVSFDEAALTEPLSVGVHAVRRCGIGVGDFVVILGAGAIGLMVLQVAKASGAEVLIADLVDSKLELARKLGADHTVNASRQDTVEAVSEATDGEMAPYVLEAVGRPETIRQMVDLACSGGTLMPIGFTGNDLDEINLSRITLSEMDLLGILGFCRDFPTSINLMKRNLVDMKSLISGHYSLDEVEDAIKFSIENPDQVVRSIVNP
jgi:L-iditol 2-dehydrogenase